jgi:hypothetical protein
MTSQTFNDVARKPSVDRAKLRTSAEETKEHQTDGVTSVVAGGVRAVVVIRNPNAKPPEPQEKFAVDVLPRPIAPDNPYGAPANPAHAQIEANPEFDTSSRFDKLKEALVRLSRARGWIIEPTKAP